MKNTKIWLVVLIVAGILISCITVMLLVKHPKISEIEQPSNIPPTVPNDASMYTVTFYSNDGTVLKIDSVYENSSATPPVAPAMTYGTVFKSWNTDFSKVSRDLEIRPVCEEVKDKPNVLAVHSRYTTKDGTVVVPIELCGDVCVSGLDITVRYNQDQLKLKAVTEDKAVIFNDATPGVIKLNYVSTKNTIADVEICNLQFYVNAAEGECPITIEINGIYAFENENETDALYIPESTVIDGKVFVVD